MKTFNFLNITICIERNHKCKNKDAINSVQSSLYDCQNHVQGYPQRMRLQRRLFGFFLVRFLAFRVPCRQKLDFCAKSYSKQLKYSIECRKKLNQALNRHISFKLLVVFTASFFVNNPVDNKLNTSI